MTTTGLYDLVTSEGDDGTRHPAEQLWTPGEDAVENGFIVHRGLHVTGMDDPTDDHLYPVGFVFLGSQRVEAGAHPPWLATACAEFAPLSGSLRGVVPGALGAAQGGRRVLKAVRRLPVLARRKVAQRPLLPMEIDAELVPPAWKKAVYSNNALPEGAVDSDAYVVCVLGQLHRALTRRDVFASPSNRVTIDRRLRIVSAPSYDPA